MGAPGGGLAGDDVKFEGCEFRPEGVLLPEEGVHEDGGGEADEQAKDAGGDNLALNADATGREEEEGVGCEEDGQFGAEDDAGDGHEVEGETGPFLVHYGTHGLWKGISQGQGGEAKGEHVGQGSRCVVEDVELAGLEE